jgi:hypothetical protein
MTGSEKSKLRKILSQVLPLVLVAVIFYVIFKRVKVEDVLVALKDVEPVRFFIVALVFVLVTFAVDAYTHYVLFKRFDYGLGLKEMFKIRLAGLLFTSLGFVYGQGGMAWLISRDAKRSPAQVVGLLGFLFFANFYAAVLWITLGMAVLLRGIDIGAWSRWLWIGIIISWPLFLAWLWFWRSRFKNLVLARLRETILYGFDQAKLRLYFEIIALRAAQFFFIAVCVRLAMPAMNIEVPFRAILGVLPIQGIIIAIPTPGRYGTNEGAYLLLFRHLAEVPKLLAFSLLWGTSANILRALFSLIAIRKLRGK